MISSTSLCPIPFLGHCDNSRLQMSAKQLAQAVTSLKCEVPKVIGRDFRFLSDSTRLFKYTAATSGELVFQNQDLIGILNNYETSSSFEISPLQQILNCTGLYATKLRHRRHLGPFSPGDILYEYDCFNQGIPTYGYNLWTAYMSFFGFNHEDAIVFSESAADLCTSTKMETLIIPVFTHSLFRLIYDDSNSLGFLPDVGQNIQGFTVAQEARIKGRGHNLINSLKSLNLTDFTKLIHNDSKFDCINISSRIPNGTVFELKIHPNPHIDPSKTMIDSNLESIIERYKNERMKFVRSEVNEFKDLMTQQDGLKVIYNHYMVRNKIEKAGFDFSELMYIIELKITGESTTHIGDKFANRYANKGVISLILPNELRPIAQYSQKPIDSIVGPISIISRMNFGQILEGLIAKAVLKAEENILADSSKITETLLNISKIASTLNDEPYAQSISELAYKTKQHKVIRDQFIDSIKELGLYFEAPAFANFDINKLRMQLQEDFQIKSTEPVILKRKLIQYINEKLKLDISIPHNDIILPNTFVAPIYTIKLKHESAAKSKSRDFGSYKTTNRQPSQGRSRDGIIAQGSRLGQMEFDGLLGHAAVKTMTELRTVKNDSQALKSDLALQIVTTGKYSLPQTNNTSSYTKMLIDSLIEMLNS